jgi:hypothetical protein
MGARAGQTGAPDLGIPGKHPLHQALPRAICGPCVKEIGRPSRYDPDTHPTGKGTSIVRIRLILALAVASALLFAGIASAATTTTTPLSDYSSTTPTTSQPKTTTSEGNTQGESESSVAPAVAAQPAGSAPSSLAFTGAEPLALIVLGLGLAGGTATLLVRERRRTQDR